MKVMLLLAVLLLPIPGLASEPPALVPVAMASDELPPSPDQVMAIPDELRRAFHAQVIDATRFPEARLERLVAFVFDEKRLGIKYEASATQPLADVYATRKVNCLTSTLLVVALAREAGLSARGQQIDRILAWGASGGTVVQSKHVNAIIDVTDKRQFVVDVDASGIEATDALHPVDDKQLLALFYSNRAMELLVEGRLQAAKRWLDEAAKYAPEDAGLWNNAGVLSLRMGDPAAAEVYFKKAIGKDPALISALSNLVAYYRDRGDSAETAYWQVRSEQLLRKDPYYQYSIGVQREQSGDLAGALHQYQRAIKLRGGEHRFHFGLARVYFRLGDYRRAGESLASAQALSEDPMSERYQDKLAALRRMRH